ncbi:MAG TPA: hypothetical protein DCQ31_12880, partial [Bacteroidales bacterium]|nr:hypothetical protein [Bacteroidales bacterium]
MSKVNKLLLHPTNNNTLLAATSTGVYRTINGGTDWTSESDFSFIDLEYKPGDFNTLYGSQDGGIYTSTDGGKNWIASYQSTGGRIELAVSPNESTWVYAIVTDSDGGLGTIQKSIDSGSTFDEVFSGSTTNLLNWDVNSTETGGQGWYDLSLAASIADANVLFVGGINTWRSTDGGLNWELNSHWSGQGEVPAIHADKHNLVFRENGDLFECNDGGIYASDDNGTNWYDLSNGLVISQIYKLGVSVLNEDETITGLQDNGTKLRFNDVWKDVNGGDGMECIIDYTDNNIQYGTYVNGEIHRTTDQWLTVNKIITPKDENNKVISGAWVTPYIIDPVDHKTLYAGYGDVWKTTDQGDTWTKISDIATTDNIRVMAIA